MSSQQYKECIYTALHALGIHCVVCVCGVVGTLGIPLGILSVLGLHGVLSALGDVGAIGVLGALGDVGSLGDVGVLGDIAS